MNEQWYIKQAYKDNYWEGESFAEFLRWYADPNRENAVIPLSVYHIIDIVEQPWKTHLRDLYFIYLKEEYPNE